MQVRPWTFECLVQWLKIREQEGHAFPQDLETFIQELDHSALLQRLIAGKRPLPIAPPLSFGYPWYDLMEKGHAEPAEVYVGDKTANEIYGYRIAVINRAVWKIESQVDEADYIVVYENHAEKYRLRRIEKEGSKVWSLERVTKSEQSRNVWV